MKTNELRIGSYYNYDGDSIKLDGSTLASYLQNDTDFNLEPILLTEECLVKFGFGKIGFNFRKYDNYNKGNREFILWYNHNSKYYEIKSNYNFYEIKYVHQLQNLYFALTNDELKII